MMWKKYCKAGQATDDSMAHVHCMLHTWGYKQTLRIRNTYSFFTATIVERTSLNVTLYSKQIFQFIKKNPTRCKNVLKVFIIPYLYEAQHVSGDTPPIIRSLKLHWQPLVFHTWKVVGRCQAHCAWKRPPTTRTNNLPLIKNQRLPVQF